MGRRKDKAFLEFKELFEPFGINRFCAEIGLAAALDEADRARMSRVIKPLAPDRGLEIMERVMSMDVAQVGVMPIDWSAFSSRFSFARIPPLFSEQILRTTDSRKKSEISSRLKSAPENKRRDILIEYLRAELAEVLEFEPPRLPDPRNNFFEMGVDSMMVVEMSNMLTVNLEVSLPATVFFKTASIEKLAEYLIEMIWGEDSDAIGKDAESRTDAEKYLYMENLGDETVESLIEDRLDRLDDIDI